MKIEEPSDLSGLVERASGGDAEALRALLVRDRERLKRIVRLRLSRVLQGRVTELDVLREVGEEAARRLDEYRQAAALPFFLWMRHLTCLKLAEIHRRHFGTPEGDRSDSVAVEVTLHGGGLPIIDAALLAAQLCGASPSASRAAAADKVEARLCVQELLKSMDAIDREVLALKHFERLTFREIALVLGMSPARVGGHYLQAIQHLKEILPWALGSPRA
jgi:RNA polymerase sigma-70 factor (ECF subfamily)